MYLPIFSEAMLKAIKSNVGRKIPTIMFTNKTATCKFLLALLSSCGVKCVALHGDVTQKVNQSSIQHQ